MGQPGFIYPADSATSLAKVQTEMRAPSPDEARRFLKVTVADDWCAWWTMLPLLGLRLSEAAGLYCSDIGGGRLTIRRALTPTYRGTPAYVHAPKTRQSRRTLVLSPTELSVLQAHKRWQAADKLAAGGAYVAELTDEQRAGGGVVFANAIGAPVNPMTLSQRPFARMLKASGLPAMRMYDLRHTSASLALASGEHVKVVSERLGHSSAMLSLNTHTQVLPGQGEDASQRSEQLLTGGA